MWTRDPIARSKTLRTVGNRGQLERTRIHLSRKMIASRFVRTFAETCETELRELDCSRMIVFALVILATPIESVASGNEMWQLEISNRTVAVDKPG